MTCGGQNIIDILKKPIYYKDLKNKEHKKKYVGGKRPHKKVIQYTLTGKYIKTYNSIKEASLATNIDSSGISKVCKGVRKSAGGYFWNTEN